MKKITKTIVAIASIFLSFQANAQAVDVRDITGFTNISTSSSVEVQIKQADEFSVQVEAPHEKINNIITELDGNTLNVYMKGTWKEKDEPKVFIRAPRYSALKSSGISSIKSVGLIESEELEVTTSGASNVKLSLKINMLKVTSSGASDVMLTGYAENLNLNASGAAEIEAEQLNVSYANVNISGAADINLDVSDTISGTTSGASNLEISSSPKVQRINQSGVSSVNGNDNDLDNDGEGVTVTFNNKEGLKVREKGDTTRITLGKKKLIIIDDWDDTQVDFQTDTTEEPWTYGIDGLFLGINGYLNSDNQLNVPEGYEFLDLDVAKSRNVQINILDGDFQLYKNYITFHPGLGLEFNSYELRNNYWIQPTSSDTGSLSAYKAFSSPTDSSELKFGKNRLKSTYLNIPIMFAFHTHDDHKKAFHVGIGGYFGTRLTSKMKYKYSLDGENRKDKIHDSYYLNPFQYGLMASVGYSNINIFTSYGLNGMFESGKGPELQPFMVGVRVIGF